MEPNYSEYTLHELEDALRDINQNAYPDRVEKIKSQLVLRYGELEAANKDLAPNVHETAQFYKCPNCSKNRSIFKSNE